MQYHERTFQGFIANMGPVIELLVDNMARVCVCSKNPGIQEARMDHLFCMDRQKMQTKLFSGYELNQNGILPTTTCCFLRGSDMGSSCAI